ncbi:MAG TPA: hypothetical protein VMT58_09190 [Candidatus Binataceae bacterium]|nr:hypothetical protein [Candidatus Binataceae bacterium]
MRNFLAIAGILAILAHAGVAGAADRWRVASVPLDMPLSDEQALDNQALEGLYQGDYGTHMPHNFGGYLGNNVKSSGLQESPFYHIDTTLKDGRKVELWFSSAEDGRKTFGVHLETPWKENQTNSFASALAELQAAWGKPDLEFSPPQTPGSQQIKIFVDRTMPKNRIDAVLARLPAKDKISTKQINDFWQSDLREWARILGPEFRGVIAIMNDSAGKLVGEQVMLIDFVRARAVFNLDEGK